LPTVVGVKLRFMPKTLWFDPAGTEPAEGSVVLVNTERGTEIGVIAEAPHEVANSALPAPLKPVVRLATQEDLDRADELYAEERKALARFRELVESHKLDMKPIDVEYLFGGDKVVFYFSSEERVDFRELVRQLAAELKVRIDMRQIGVRDEARLVGGIGHCGQQLCCSRLSGDFQPVSIRMAKEQDLPLNPLKISGLCGRLMCCLRYEYDAYKDFKTRAPKRGAIIETAVGLGKVTDLNTPKETVSMRLEDGTSFTVPLASMSCSKGSGCPCSVSREALESVGKVSSLLAAPPSELRESEPQTSGRKPRRRVQSAEPEQGRSSGQGKAAQAKSAQGGDRSGGRSGGKPDNRGVGKGGSGGQKADGSTSPAPQAGAQGEQPKSSSGTGRRRRRRRSGGGGAKPEGTPTE
jgi:cell fate regulator YaaT (PSP1 superfamily)